MVLIHLKNTAIVHLANGQGLYRLEPFLVGNDKLSARFICRLLILCDRSFPHSKRCFYIFVVDYTFSSNKSRVFLLKRETTLLSTTCTQLFVIDNVFHIPDFKSHFVFDNNKVVDSYFASLTASGGDFCTIYKNAFKSSIFTHS
jgi:hypothetical protein